MLLILENLLISIVTASSPLSPNLCFLYYLYLQCNFFGIQINPLPQIGNYSKQIHLELPSSCPFTIFASHSDTRRLFLPSTTKFGTGGANSKLTQPNALHF
jgi:hypothetical protein